MSKGVRKWLVAPGALLWWRHAHAHYHSSLSLFAALLADVTQLSALSGTPPNFNTPHQTTIISLGTPGNCVGMSKGVRKWLVAPGALLWWRHAHAHYHSSLSLFAALLADVTQLSGLSGTPSNLNTPHHTTIILLVRR
ncbi:hypothetical protein J6590_091850 [Homalodisca vitripennis]|nr:hypothetical protein J6590_091850 [Homalodisca vitripennis]